MLPKNEAGRKGAGYAVVLHDIYKSYVLHPSPFERIRGLFTPEGHKKGQRAALSGVTLSVEPGDVLGIIGRNGSGKSTLLRIISGIVPPTSGSVKVRGRVSALLELGAGFDPKLTGRENVCICGAILGLSQREIAASLDDILAFSEIGAFIDQPVRMYSSGMYVRLAFALAICVTPDILIVDEALAVGDTLFQAKCFARMKELRTKGVTIIFVTHSLDLISRLCTKACLLERGRMISFGLPTEVLGDYSRIVANQGVSPTNAIDGRNSLSEYRYGNGRAVIDRIEIIDGNGRSVCELTKNETYEFRVHVQFFARIAEPVFSFRIRDSDGMDVTGTNTLYHNIDTRVFQPGETVVVSFSQRIPLRHGEYSLSASCAGFEEGTYVVYDRRYDALSFKVCAKNPSAGLVDLAASIRITRTEQNRLVQV